MTRSWAAEVARRLDGYAASVRFVEAAEGKDAADHVVSGYGVDEFAPFDDPTVATDRDRVTLVSLPTSSGSESTGCGLATWRRASCTSTTATRA